MSKENLKSGVGKDKNTKKDDESEHSEKEEIVKGWKTRSRGGEAGMLALWFKENFVSLFIYSSLLNTYFSA